MRLVWPAVNEETMTALGEGYWLPSLNWVDVFGCSTIRPQVDRAPGPGDQRPLRPRHPFRRDAVGNNEEIGTFGHTGP